MELEHGFARLSEVRLHHVTAGEGPLVVMLHGFPDFWYCWRAQIPPLVERSHRVVAVDMRGYNLSDKPDGVGSYALERLVGDVTELIRHLGEERAHVVGHDWGAIVAWHLAMWEPEVVDRLAILNVPHPSRFGDGLFDPRQLYRSRYIAAFQIPSLPERWFAANDFANLRRTLRAGSKTFTRDELELYVEAARRSHALRYPMHYYRAMIRRFVQPNTGEWKVIQSPVLVLWGDRDPAIESRLAEPDPEWVPDARVVHVPDAGHWVHRDAPERVDEELVSFLTGVR